MEGAKRAVDIPTPKRDGCSICQLISMHKPVAEVTWFDHGFLSFLDTSGASTSVPSSAIRKPKPFSSFHALTLETLFAIDFFGTADLALQLDVWLQVPSCAIMRKCWRWEKPRNYHRSLTRLQHTLWSTPQPSHCENSSQFWDNLKVWWRGS